MEMIARDIMSAPVYFVTPDETIAHARRLMLKHKISRVLVMDGKNLAGILTKKDIAFRFREQEPAWRRRPVDRIPVESFATKNPVTVGPDTGTKKIIRLFIEKDISSLPVVEDGAVVGIVTKTDLMKSALMNGSKSAGQGRDGGCRDTQQVSLARSRHRHDERTERQARRGQQ